MKYMCIAIGIKRKFVRFVWIATRRDKLSGWLEEEWWPELDTMYPGTYYFLVRAILFSFIICIFVLPISTWFSKLKYDRDGTYCSKVHGQVFLASANPAS